MSTNESKIQEKNTFYGSEKETSTRMNLLKSRVLVA